MQDLRPPDVVQREALALAGRLARGDASAEAELVVRYRPGLIALLRHRSGDVSRAEDLCHDTLRIAIEKLRAGALRDPLRLASYLRGIAVNLSRHDHRGAWRRTPMDGIAEPVDPRNGPQECLLASDRVRRVRLVLKGLGERDREILTAFYLEGHEKSVVCERRGLSGAQFDVIKFRALGRFARLWAAHEENLRER